NPPMRKSSNMPGWRSLACRYCCIMGVIDGCVDRRKSLVAEAMAVYSPRRTGLSANLAHRQTVSGRMEHDFGHVVLHQQETAAARTLQILHGHTIRDFFGIEALALVPDQDFETVAANMVIDGHLL